MTLLVLGLLLFVAAHLWKPMFTAHRVSVAARIGEGPVKALVALASVGSVVLMVIGYQNAPYIDLWGRPGWAVHVNNLLMVLAVCLFIAGGIPGHVRHWVRHPQLNGLKTWAVAHLFPNGDVASVILFGGLLAWGVVAMIVINKRDGKGPKPGPGTVVGNLIHVGATAVVFVAIALAHNWAGIWPFAGSPPG